MGDTIDISIEGRHGSISEFEWTGIPRLAVLTGENGVGKTQLLEVIANTYQVMQPRPWQPRTMSGYPPIAVGAKARINGAEFLPGEVFHSRGEWRPFFQTTTNLQQVKEAINGLQGSRENTWFWNTLAEKSGLTKEELYALKPAEFRNYLTPMLVWGARTTNDSPNQSIDFLFLLYKILADAAGEDGLDSKAIIERYGEPPWVILNQILDAAGLRYRIEAPKHISRKLLDADPSLSVLLTDRESGDAISLTDVSSGEKVLISTTLWWFGATQLSRHPRLLLLDEPDAHLHPAFTRRFLDIVQRVFIDARGVRVIMTSHSPSTVALTPQENLFEMRRRAFPRIIPTKSKGHTIALLTAGFLVVEEATQIVFVEGKDDPEFYALLWDILTHREGESEPEVLAAAPNLVFVHGNGAPTVYSVVRQLRALGLKRFHGIVDHDTNNIGEDGVHVIQRNELENYLYDPLNVWVYLHMQGTAPNVDGVKVQAGLSFQIGRLSSKQLQLIVDTMCQLIEQNVPGIVQQPNQRREVMLGGQIVLKYPEWMFTSRDKKLRAAFHKTFPLGSQSDKKLHQSLATLRLVPTELRKTLKAIQDEAFVKHG